jgi:hypothetical protein
MDSVEKMLALDAIAHTQSQSFDLQAARLEAYLKYGASPRQRGREKALKALDWVYRWGWAAPATIDQLNGEQARGLAKRLVDRGLLVATKTQAGYGFEYVPAKMLTLSKFGINEIERERSQLREILEAQNANKASMTMLLEYKVDPYRINQNNLRHDNIVQLATLNKIKAGEVIEFFTERELKHFSKKEVKQPDAVWRLISDELASIELELSGKWDRAFALFVHKTIQTLDPKEPKYNACYVLFDSAATRSRYEAAFVTGSKYDGWFKNMLKNQIWEKTSERKTVPSWIEGKVHCMML